MCFQVRIIEPPKVCSDEEVPDEDETGPIIAAIKEELQKFQRPKSPNLSGITVIPDPELIKKD